MSGLLELERQDRIVVHASMAFTAVGQRQPCHVMLSLAQNRALAGV